MDEIIFNDKNMVPSNSVLADKLGTSYDMLKEITKYIKDQIGETKEEWKFYGQKYGWQLKTFLKKRNLFFVIPYQSYFKIVFIFGDKAVVEIEKSDINAQLKIEVINAQKYAEGRGLPIEVKDNTYIEDIKKLIKIKINN